MINPTISTVTYLTSNSERPTVVFGEQETLISFPRQGNHLAFSGKLLHGVPLSFQKLPADTKQQENLNRQHC